MRKVKIAARAPLAKDGPYSAFVGPSGAARAIGWDGMVIGFSSRKSSATVVTQMWCLTRGDAARLGNALLAAAKDIR